jgi:hypothetical protein
MHPRLKNEGTKPPALNFLQQQARFDDVIEMFNEEPLTKPGYERSG